ncbi:MAG: hypothetical protein KAG26_09080 [Methylococcales bacterium]|nr:hypothetical protein [Methylococcales bacterium]
MVQGLEKFKEFFAGFEGSYIVIGGTACDLILSDAGLIPRATKDIDIILVVEALSKEFGEKFWEFIEAGGYQQRERSPENLEYFRFLKPSNTDFPKQLELFARTPDTFDLPPEAQLSQLGKVEVEAREGDGLKDDFTDVIGVINHFPDDDVILNSVHNPDGVELPGVNPTSNEMRFVVNKRMVYPVPE